MIPRYRIYLFVFIFFGLAVSFGRFSDAIEPVALETAAAIPAEEQRSQAFKFDLQAFSGERAPLNREYSNRIKGIGLSLTLPPQCALVVDSPSFVNIFTQEKEFIAKVDIVGLETQIPLEQTIDSKRIYLEAGLHYSCAGESDPVLFKNVLFDTPLVNYPKPENIEIHYNLSTS